MRREPPNSTERYTRWVNQLTPDQLLTQVLAPQSGSWPGPPWSACLFMWRAGCGSSFRRWFAPPGCRVLTGERDSVSEERAWGGGGAKGPFWEVEGSLWPGWAGRETHRPRGAVRRWSATDPELQGGVGRNQTGSRPGGGGAGRPRHPSQDAADSDTEVPTVIPVVLPCKETLFPKLNLENRNLGITERCVWSSASEVRAARDSGSDAELAEHTARQSRPGCAKPGTHVPALPCRVLGAAQTPGPVLLAPCSSEARPLGAASHVLSPALGLHAARLRWGALHPL